MRFETAFVRYQDGTASEEERFFVEQELEKARLIEAYLAEESLPPLPDLEEAAESEMKAVKRRLNRRNGKIVLGTAALVLAVLMLAQWVLFPALNRRAYREEEGLSEFDAFVQVYTALHIPRAVYTGSDVRDSGFGTQTIGMQFWDQAGRSVRVQAKLKLGRLGELSGETEALIDAGYRNAGHFRFDERQDGAWETEEREKLLAAVEELPEYIRLSAAVTFEEDLALEELTALLGREELRGLEQISAAIPTNNGGQPIYLDLTPGGLNLGEWNEAYPQLQRDGNDPDALQTHLESELSYLADHTKLSHWLNDLADHPHMGYRAMLDQIREHGVVVRGLYVTASPAELLELWETGLVSYLWPMDAQIAFP